MFVWGQKKAQGPVIKVISHRIFRNLKAFLYGEEHRMYLCNLFKATNVIHHEVNYQTSHLSHARF